MRKTLSLVVAFGLLGGLVWAKDATSKKKAVEKTPAAEEVKKEAVPETKAEPAAEAKTEAAAPEAGEAPEVIVMDKTNKMAPVKFPHKMHGTQFVKEGCAACHEGEKPLFAKKRNEEGLKMKDMYTGQTCGACHDGKKAFNAKTGCMKCHKK